MLTVMLALALAATAAESPAADPAGTTQAAKPAKPKKICERVEVTGSRVGKRECRIVAEPKAKTETANEDAGKTASGGTR